jgi:hypothetical protein
VGRDDSPVYFGNAMRQLLQFAVFTSAMSAAGETLL